MIKRFLVVLVVGAVALGFNTGSLKKIMHYTSNTSAMEKQTSEISKQITNVEAELGTLKKQCDGIEFNNNLDVAKQLSKLKGAKLQSIASLVTKDGELYECSEVVLPDDVIFFNDAIEKIRYTFKLSDPKVFLNALNESAIATESVKIDTAEKTAVIMVTSIGSILQEKPALDGVGGENYD